MDKSRWGVVIAGLIILMCLGVAYSWGVFLTPIEKDLGWKRAQISLAVSILLLVFSVFMVVGGICEKKYGPRITATIGGVLVSLGWMAASYSHSRLWLYLSYGIVVGIGTGLSYMPSISSGIKWFPEKKGLVTGIIVFGFGFGTAFLSPLMTQLIKAYNWRGAMLICGVIFGVIIISAAQFLKVPKINAATIKESSINTSGCEVSPLQMIKSSLFILIFFTYFIAMIAGMMSIGHIVAFMQGKNFSEIQSVFALSILSVFNGVGRITFGALSDRFGIKNILALLFSIIGGSVFLLCYLDKLVFMYIISGFIGLCFGGFLSVYPALTADYFGSRYFSINYGLVFLGYGSGCFIGPLLGGYIYDITHSYLIAFKTAGALALLGGLLILFALAKPKKVYIQKI